MTRVKEVAKCVLQLKSESTQYWDDYDVKRWENTYIYHQIKRRKDGETFTIKDHIRGMVYSMLSSNIPWDNLNNMIDVKTGRIETVDAVFFQYDISKITEDRVRYFYEKLKEIEEPKRIIGFSTRKQMEALVKNNIPRLKAFEIEGGIEKNYDKYIDSKGEDDIDYKRLVKALSTPGSESKMVQLGVPLASEYLRNVGYDLPKPDRHICRILGKDLLGFSDKKYADPYEAIDFVKSIASEAGLSISETDYYLWSYCAKGYREICTKRNAKHDICCFKNICHYV